MTLEPPALGGPELSVVMVTHGAWGLTQRALAALAKHTSRVFELILVDNDSDRETRAQLSRVDGARVILNEQNRGFGPAVNQGAELARAEHLLLLNTDAFVHPGWLDPLLQALTKPEVAAAVPRYLHPDGLLQEAGVLLAADGTVHVYGDHQDPSMAPYRFPRTIDYGSAVCMLMRAAVFTELGGFDDCYSPAYYEDADLCLRLAQRGLRVVYEPRSTVTHVRYGSGGSEVAAGLSERNRSLFAERWGAALAGRPASFVNASEQAVIAARDAVATPRLLVCSGADEPGAAALVGSLLDCWPDGRLTWVTDARPARGGDPSDWLARGVEVLDQADVGWLNDRLFHYDAIIQGAQSGASLRAALERTQPQAARVALQSVQRDGERSSARLAEVLASAGIAPPPLLPSER